MDESSSGLIYLISFSQNLGVGGGWGVGPKFMDLSLGTQKSYGLKPYGVPVRCGGFEKLLFDGTKKYTVKIIYLKSNDVTAPYATRKNRQKNPHADAYMYPLSLKHTR